jgi:hypothetical protein
VVTGRTDPFDDDPQLRSLLRGGDPATALSPADPEGLATLLHRIQEDDMTEQSNSSRRTWLVAAAAAVLIGGGGYAVFGSDGDPAGPTVASSSGPSTPPSPAGPVVMTLAAPAATAGKCAVPSAELLAGFEVAFEGTVTEVDGDTVTLVPTTTFAGERADEVVLSNALANVGLLNGAVLEEGGTYLIAASDGQVSACGFSGPARGDLRRLYDAAFG